MTALLFWIAYFTTLAIAIRSPLYTLAERIFTAPDGEPYYPQKKSARADLQATHAPTTQTTTARKAAQ